LPAIEERLGEEGSFVVAGSRGFAGVFGFDFHLGPSVAGFLAPHNGQVRYGGGFRLEIRCGNVGPDERNLV